MVEYRVKVYSDRTEWYNLDGQLHREDGPAFSNAKGDKHWYVNNVLHRVDGPAIEISDGYKEWRINNERHRLNGPAIEYANGDKCWYIDDKRHRLDGPAIEYSDGDKSWYIYGIKLSEETFLKKTQPKREMTMEDLEKELGFAIKIVK